jgi:hypothetical protein
VLVAAPAASAVGHDQALIYLGKIVQLFAR